jgi:SSS family transporter
MGYVIGIAFYMAVMLAIGFIVSKKNVTAEDYLVAGRSFNVWFNTATILITFVGAVLFIGDSGLAFSTGIWNTEYNWGMIATAGGGSLCLLLLGVFFVPVLWKLKYVSVGDFYMNRYGKICGVSAALLIALTSSTWIATNVTIFGKIVAPLIGWDISTVIWIGIIVLAIYTYTGGMYAVCYTDVVQVIIMLIGFAILLPLTVNLAGGLTEVLQGTPEAMKSVLPQQGGSWTPWLAAWLIIGLGSTVSPDLAQRSFTAKSASVARKSFLIAMGIFFILELGVLLIGYSGHILAEKGLIDGTLIFDDPELLMPILIKTLMPTGVAIMFFGAVIAGVMGASDSALIAVSAIISKNIYEDILRPDATDAQVIKVTRTAVVFVAIFSGLLATSYPHVLELSLYAFDLMLACLVAPFILGLYFKPSNGVGAFAAMVAGFLFRTIGAGLSNGFTLESVFYPENWYVFTLGSPIVSTLALVLFSLLTQKQNPPLPLKCADGTVFVNQHAK